MPRLACDHCGSSQHLAPQCKRCRSCNEFGHISGDCPRNGGTGYSTLVHQQATQLHRHSKKGNHYTLPTVQKQSQYDLPRAQNAYGKYGDNQRAPSLTLVHEQTVQNFGQPRPERLCFNCWESDRHDDSCCPRPRESMEKRDQIRYSKGIPQFDRWNTLLERCGLEPTEDTVGFGNAKKSTKVSATYESTSVSKQQCGAPRELFLMDDSTTSSVSSLPPASSQPKEIRHGTRRPGQYPGTAHQTQSTVQYPSAEYESQHAEAKKTTERPKVHFQGLNPDGSMISPQPQQQRPDDLIRLKSAPNMATRRAEEKDRHRQMLSQALPAESTAQNDGFEEEYQKHLKPPVPLVILPDGVGQIRLPADVEAERGERRRIRKERSEGSKTQIVAKPNPLGSTSQSVSARASETTQSVAGKATAGSSDAISVPRRSSTSTVTSSSTMKANTTAAPVINNAIAIGELSATPSDSCASIDITTPSKAPQTTQALQKPSKLGTTLTDLEAVLNRILETQSNQAAEMQNLFSSRGGDDASIITRLEELECRKDERDELLDSVGERMEEIEKQLETLISSKSKSSAEKSLKTRNVPEEIYSRILKLENAYKLIPSMRTVESRIKGLEDKIRNDPAAHYDNSKALGDVRSFANDVKSRLGEVEKQRAANNAQTNATIRNIMNRLADLEDNIATTTLTGNNGAKGAVDEDLLRRIEDLEKQAGNILSPNIIMERFDDIESHIQVIKNWKTGAENSLQRIQKDNVTNRKESLGDALAQIVDLQYEVREVLRRLGIMERLCKELEDEVFPDGEGTGEQPEYQLIE